MKALLIKDELHWHPDWSSQLGTVLATRDSSNNLLIFAEGCSEQDIRKVIGKASPDMYEILDLEEAPREDCDFMADSGLCYRKLH